MLLCHRLALSITYHQSSSRYLTVSDVWQILSSGFTRLQFVPSLRLPSSSSDAWRLPVFEFVREGVADEAREDIFDCAFLETVLPLSRAWRRRSGIFASQANTVYEFMRRGTVLKWGKDFSLKAVVVIVSICGISEILSKMQRICTPCGNLWLVA
jgi:hypothetical protein